VEPIDTSVCQPARRYNYWLGGKDHFAADRASGDALAALFPTVVTAARANRDFLRRGVQFVARQGVRQFIDIGTGLPVPDNTHEVAQRVNPEARVVYVDNDPIVMTHARALTVCGPSGRTAYVEADLREPETILGHAAVRDTLDLREPVGLLLIAVLHFVHDDAEARSVVGTLLDALAPGSYLVASNATTAFATAEEAAGYDALVAAGKSDVRTRPPEGFGAFFDSLDLVEPGVVAVSEWRPDAGERPPARDVSILGAVGRKA
jgi:hypothetical protein